MRGIVKNIFWKLIVLLMMICGFLLFIHLVESESKEYEGSGNKRLKANISEGGVSRIAVEGDRIWKVVGNGEEYSIEGDGKKGIIFITSKVMGGEVIPITIITEKGFMQDIRLRVQKGREPGSIVIKKPVSKGSNGGAKKGDVEVVDIKQEVIGAIREASGGNTRDYSFRRIDIKSLSKSRKDLGYRGYNGLVEKGIKVRRITEYTNRYLKIYKYEYEEKPTALMLNEITKIFKGSLGVSERGNGIYVVYREQQGGV